jgi:hypothetical protein
VNPWQCPLATSDVQTKKGEVLKFLSFKELERNRKDGKEKIADISASMPTEL